MITHKNAKPNIPKSINKQMMNNLSFTEICYILARLTKIDQKMTTSALDKKTLISLLYNY